MRKNFLLASLIVLLSVSPTFSKKPRASGDEAELLRLEAVWNEAQLRNDANALDRLWAEEVVMTISGMPLMNKAESLAIARAARVKFQSYKTSDLRVRVFG